MDYLAHEQEIDARNQQSFKFVTIFLSTILTLVLLVAWTYLYCPISGFLTGDKSIQCISSTIVEDLQKQVFNIKSLQTVAKIDDNTLKLPDGSTFKVNQISEELLSLVDTKISNQNLTLEGNVLKLTNGSSVELPQTNNYTTLNVNQTLVSTGATKLQTLSVLGTAQFEVIPKIPLDFGSLLVGNSSGDSAELKAGSSGQILTMVNGTPKWVDSPTVTNTITISDSTNNEQVIGGDTITYKVGSSNNLSVKVSSTDTVTYDIIKSPTFDNLTVNNKIDAVNLNVTGTTNLSGNVTLNPTSINAIASQLTIGGALSGNLTNTVLGANTVNTTNIVDNSVTLAKIANCNNDGEILKYYSTDPVGPITAGWNCVADTTSSNISSSDIQDGTITNIDIADSTITFQKLANCGTDSQILKYYTTDPDGGAGPLKAGWNCDTDIIGSAGSTYTADSGLTMVATNTRLGGTLQIPTSIGTTATNTLSLTGLLTGSNTNDLLSINASGVIQKGKIADLLPNDSITSAMIKDGSVQLVDMAADSINSSKIVDGSVALVDLAADSVNSSKIVDASIALADMGNDSVNSAKIVDGSVSTADLANGAVTLAKIAACSTDGQILKYYATDPDGGGSLVVGWNCDTDSTTATSSSITSTMIVDGTINTIDLADGSVTSIKIADGTVALADLAGDSVNSSKIVDGSVALADLAADSVNSSKILDGSVALADLGANSVNSSKIVDGSVATADLANGAVTLAKMAACTANGQILKYYTSDPDGAGALVVGWNCDTDSTTPGNASITSAMIVDATIATADIATGAVTSTTILDGTVALIDLAGNSVNSSKIVDGSIATADIANSAITLAKLANCTSNGQILKYYTADPDGAGSLTVGWNCDADSTTPGNASITSAMIVDGTIVAADISIGGVNSTNILDGTVALADLAANSVNSAKIVDGSVTSTDILDATITLADLASNSVNSSKIVDGSVGLADLAPCALLDQILQWNGTAWVCAAGPLQVTADNGLTSPANNYVELGGTLIQHTSISTAGLYDFTLSSPTGRNFTFQRSGFVGIGTTTPVLPLEVRKIGTSPGTVLFEGSQHQSNFFSGASETTYINGGKDASDIYIASSNLNTGNILMASNAPAVAGKNSVIIGLNIVPTNKLVVVDTSTANVAKFQTAAGTNCIVVAGTGWTCSSDMNLKKDITPFDEALNTVNKLKPVSFEWKQGDGSTQYGFIAQDVMNVIPELVTKPEGSDYYSLNTIGMIPFVVKSVQEIDKKVSQIELDETELKHEIEVLNTSFNTKVGDIFDQKITEYFKDNKVLYIQENSDLNIRNLNISQNIIVKKDIIINGNTTLEGLTTLNGVVKFNQEIQVSSNSAGTAVIEPNVSKVQVLFTNPQSSKPIIALTQVDNVSRTDYAVVNTTINGFEILINNPQLESVKFNWIALSKN